MRTYLCKHDFCLQSNFIYEIRTFFTFCLCSICGPTETKIFIIKMLAFYGICPFILQNKASRWGEVKGKVVCSAPTNKFVDFVENLG